MDLMGPILLLLSLMVGLHLVLFRFFGPPKLLRKCPRVNLSIYVVRDDTIHSGPPNGKLICFQSLCLLGWGLPGILYILSYHSRKLYEVI